MEYGPLKNIVNDTMFPQSGSFSLEEPINWQKCRETFANLFTPNIPGFYFSYSTDRIDISDSIYNFILKTEDILRVSDINLNPTKISKTNRNFAIWVEPSSFWKECEFKRSLFTIFLRCGINYNDDDYEKALLSQKYVEDTIIAVKRFLLGFTNYNYGLDSPPKRGWVNAFINVKKDDVKTLLTKSSTPKNESNFFGVGSLWS